MLDYRTHIKKGSMFNTPPVLPIFSALQTLRYYKQLGGLKELGTPRPRKSSYALSGYRRQQDVYRYCHRSRRPLDYERLLRDDSRIQGTRKRLHRFRGARGIVGIKGHRSVGGFRASLYNALPIESVKVLVEAMRDFESTHQ